MKLSLAALIACEIEDIMSAADRPELDATWRHALAKLREGKRKRIGIRFRPRHCDSDWCIGSRKLLEIMHKTVQLSWYANKEELFLIKLRGSLEPLEKYALLCKIDEPMWGFSKVRSAPWGGFGFESTYYVGEENPWPGLIGEII